MFYYLIRRLPDQGLRKICVCEIPTEFSHTFVSFWIPNCKVYQLKAKVYPYFFTDVIAPIFFQLFCELACESKFSASPNQAFNRRKESDHVTTQITFKCVFMRW